MGRTPARTARLWVEWTTLFVLISLAQTFLLSPRQAFTTLLVMTGIGLILLLATPGFRLRSLVSGWRVRDVGFVLLFTVGAAALLCGLVLWLQPARFLGLPRRVPELWLAIMAIYPFASALPQEILFRALFFERYGGLFGVDAARAAGRTPWIAIIVNALVFGLAHLFYWNWVALSISTLGGLVFAYAYVARRSFPLAWILHTIGGQILFTAGLGLYFYHGAAPG